MAYYIDTSSFAGRIDELNDTLTDDLVSSSAQVIQVNNELQNLKQIREIAYKNLSNFLDKLGYGTDVEAGMIALNDAINRFHALTFNFNSEALRENIINPARGIAVNKIKLEANRLKKLIKQDETRIPQLFNKLIAQTVENLQIDPTFMDPNAPPLEDLVHELFSQLNFQVIMVMGGGTTVTSKTVPKGGKLLSKDVERYLTQKLEQKLRHGESITSFTARDLDYITGRSNLKERIISLAQENGMDVSWFINDVPTMTNSITTNDNSITLNYVSDFIGPFMDKMTPVNGTIAENAAKAYFEAHPEEVDNLYDKACNYFHQILTTENVNPAALPKMQETFDKALKSIVYSYPASFFVGNNIVDGIIGIAGELQGLYYVYSILGENNKLGDIDFAWIGGNTDVGGGVKSGADIVVQLSDMLGYGIQIKNSMSENARTSFSNFVLNQKVPEASEFYKQLEAFGFGQEIVSAIEDLKTMEKFNISYVHDPIRGNGIRVIAGPHANSALGAEYDKAYEQIPKLIEKANKLMAIAAAAIMRIQYLDGSNFQEANTLWFVGGTAAISSVQILDSLIAQVDDVEGRIKNFNARTTVTMNGQNATIVEYINAHGGNMSGLSSLKTTLSTSYNFHHV